MKNFTIQLHNQEITNTGVAAIIDFYHVMSIDQLQYLDVFAFVTRIDSPFLNVVIDNRSSRQNSTDLIKSISHFFAKYQVPWGWYVTPGTHENDYLKCGIGTALTVHMMKQAKQLGLKHCFLDSSTDGFSVYKKIGFTVYSTTLIYVKP